MKKSYRVKSEKDFNAIFKVGQSFANRKFVIYKLEKKQKHFRKGVEILTYPELEQNLLHVLKIAKIYQEGLSCEKEK